MKHQSLIYYFAYGYNTWSEGMSGRGHHSPPVGKAVLHDFKLEFAKHADITEAEGESMEGVLWLITPEVLEMLDLFEGYPTYYIRREVNVQVGDDMVEAIVYQMRDRCRELLPPTEGYENVLRMGYEEHGLDTLAIDKAIEACY